MSEAFSAKLDWTETGYRLLENLVVYSERYDNYIVGLEGDEFDGATGAIDLNPLCFIPHDIVCRDCCFADLEPVTNRMASLIYYDQMRRYGYSRTRSSIRFLFTFFLGGKNIKRTNGWW